MDKLGRWSAGASDLPFISRMGALGRKIRGSKVQGFGAYPVPNFVPSVDKCPLLLVIGIYLSVRPLKKCSDRVARHGRQGQRGQDKRYAEIAALKKARVFEIWRVAYMEGKAVFIIRWLLWYRISFLPYFTRIHLPQIIRSHNEVHAIRKGRNIDYPAILDVLPQDLLAQQVAYGYAYGGIIVGNGDGDGLVRWIWKCFEMCCCVEGWKVLHAYGGRGEFDDPEVAFAYMFCQITIIRPSFAA